MIYINNYLKCTILFIIVLLLLNSGCTAEKTQVDPPLNEEIEGFPVTVVDDLGREVSINSLPDRIISLAPGITEVLYFLKLENKIIAVTDFCDYPLEAQDKEKIGGFQDPSLEKIIALEPDLVIGTEMHQPILSELQQLSAPVFISRPRNLNEIHDAIIDIGRITGQQKEAKELVDDMKKRATTIQEKVDHISEEERPRVFYELWHDPLQSVGPGTYINDLIQLAGGINIAGDADDSYPLYSLEVLIEENPDVYIAGAGSMSSPGDIHKRSGWGVLKAVKNNRVHIMEDENIVYRPTPRIIDGLEEIAQLLYPELF